MSLRWTLQFWGRQTHFEAGRHTAGHAGTFGGRQIWMLHFGAIEFSQGFASILFQVAFLRWALLLQF